MAMEKRPWKIPSSKEANSLGALTVTPFNRPKGTESVIFPPQTAIHIQINVVLCCCHLAYVLRFRERSQLAFCELALILGIFKALPESAQTCLHYIANRDKASGIHS